MNYGLFFCLISNYTHTGVTLRVSKFEMYILWTSFSALVLVKRGFEWNEIINTVAGSLVVSLNNSFTLIKLDNTITILYRIYTTNTQYT